MLVFQETTSVPIPLILIGMVKHTPESMLIRMAQATEGK
jgi:hypothetical protein